MDKFFEYAPVIIVVVGFCYAYKVFVTPRQLTDRLTEFEEKLDKKFVHHEAHDIVIAALKEDIQDIKSKIDKIYDKIIGV